MVGIQRDRDYNGYFNLATELASLYVGKDGMGEKEAAQKAFNDLIGNRYTFADTYRIPKDPAIDPAAIQRGAYEARQEMLRARNGQTESPFGNITLQTNDIGLSDNEADSRSNFSRDGIFVTSPRNDGLNLAYHNGFVSGPDGRPILLTWAHLAQMGGTKEAKATEATRALQGSGQMP